MGSSESGAGSIVWVRRRNGSWWPGKILGTDELSSSHVMSPRSGTPVKLLGKEDASVDWYNLEKSKRVKVFRCGEFDDCIDRAEASLGLPARKREKYARREDAILHALELEKQILEKYGKVGTSISVRENSSDSERKDLSASLGALENGNRKLGHHGLYQHGKKVDLSNLMERCIPLHAQKARDANHPSLQEHNTEASHQMRGLQELGLRTVPVNRMIYTSAASDDSNRMTIDGHAHVVSAIDPCFENSSDSDSRNSTGKGKRLLEGFVDESLPKRHDMHHIEMPDSDFISKYGKDKTGNLPSGSPDKLDTNHGPKGQMEISVSRLEVGNSHLQHGTSAEKSTSGSSEETESDYLETHSLEQHVDAGVMLSDVETHIRPQPSMLDRLEMRSGHESTSNDESDQLSLGDRPRFYHHGPIPTCFGVSKWQLKGKRNIRKSTKRHADRVTHRTYVERRGRSLNQRGPSHHSLSYYHDNDCSSDVDIIENDSSSPTQGFGKRGYLPSRAIAKSENVGCNTIDWGDLTRGRPFREFWDDNPTFVFRNGHDMLIDVDLKVQANRQGELVPWVSLMSRLNGKAIIGHPIQIEPLEDGSTDVLVSIIDRNRAPPVWSTARRTANFRMPHHHPPSQLDGDADDRYFHQCGKVQSKRPLVKKTPPVSRSQLQGMKKKKKKPPRKVNPSKNPKTRALSSISYDQKLSNKRGVYDINTSYYVGGVIKPVDSGTPAMACIPVKLVFSRLLEAVGRPPSGPEIRREIPHRNL